MQSPISSGVGRWSVAVDIVLSERMHTTNVCLRYFCLTFAWQRVAMRLSARHAEGALMLVVQSAPSAIALRAE